MRSSFTTRRWKQYAEGFSSEPIFHRHVSPLKRSAEQGSSTNRKEKEFFPLQLKSWWKEQHWGVRLTFYVLLAVHVGTALGWLYWHFFGR